MKSLIIYTMKLIFVVQYILSDDADRNRLISSKPFKNLDFKDLQHLKIHFQKAQIGVTHLKGLLHNI